MWLQDQGELLAQYGFPCERPHAVSTTDSSESWRFEEAELNSGPGREEAHLRVISALLRVDSTDHITLSSLPVSLPTPSLPYIPVLGVDH